MRAWVLLFLTMSTQCVAGDIFSLREVDVGYKNYRLVSKYQQDSLIYPEHPGDSISVDLKTDVLTYLYWDSMVHGTTAGEQYRSIGLEMRLGVRLSDEIRFGWYHHSQHVLDREHEYMWGYPHEDALELRLKLYGSKQGREALF